MSNEERPSLGDATWLLERMNAKKAPITAAQVRKFGQYPAGPILPDLCLEAKRLPTIMEKVFLAPGDEPGFIATIREPDTGKNWKVCIADNQTYQLEITNLPHYDWGVELLGFVNGIPLCKLTFAHNVSDLALASAWELSSGSPNRIVLGKEEVLKLRGMDAVKLFSDGSIVFSAHNDEPGSYRICRYRDGETEVLVPSTAHEITRFIEMEHGKIAYLRNVENEKGMKKQSAAMIGENINTPRYTDGIADIVKMSTGWYYIILDYSVRGVIPSISKFAEASERDWSPPLGTNEYRSDFTELPDLRMAYIGKSQRDYLRCWVIQGVAQPAFKCVSQLFKRGDRWCYYGIIDHHLYTIALPEPD